VVSPHLVPMIDMVVTPLQSSLDLTPIVKGGVFPIPITMHPFQSGIEEVIIPMKYLVNPTLLEESDASFDHFINIPDPTPSE
jgi:hypothetical protein